MKLLREIIVFALTGTRTACYNTNNFRAKQKLPKGS